MRQKHLLAPVILCLFATSGQAAFADAPHCGQVASRWSAPDGALVVQSAGAGMVGQLMTAIGEGYGHSMISHGYYNGLSHATRTEDSVQSIVDSASLWSQAVDLGDGDACSTPIDAQSLTVGWPGTERVSVGGAYAFTENNAALSASSPFAPDLKYYETVSWLSNSVSVPGECQNPRFQQTRVDWDAPDEGAPAGQQIVCDAIPNCPNPHYNGGAYVTCDPIASCSNTPQVMNNIITCDVGFNSCNNGGHIDVTPPVIARPGPITIPRPVSPPPPPPGIPHSSPGKFPQIVVAAAMSTASTNPSNLVCTPNVVATTCVKWGPPPAGQQLPQCLQWGSGVADNPEADARAAAISSRPASQAYSYGGYGVDFSATPDGPSVTSFLENHYTISITSDQNAAFSFARYADKTEAPNGYYYDFHQFQDSDSTPLGDIGNAHGVVCSTFLSWAQMNGTKKAIVPHTYTGQQVAAAAGAVFQSGFEACQQKLDKLSTPVRDALKARCGGLDPICDSAGWQIANCFSDGSCGSSSQDLFAATTSGSKTAYSISPDRLAGVGVHSPVGTAKGAANGDPSQSVWAQDVGTDVHFDGAGQFGCWE